MIKYLLSLDINEYDIMLGDGETYDEWVAKNFFDLIADKIKELHVEGGVGFANYAHIYENKGVEYDCEKSSQLPTVKTRELAEDV